MGFEEISKIVYEAEQVNVVNNFFDEDSRLNGNPEAYLKVGNEYKSSES